LLAAIVVMAPAVVVLLAIFVGHASDVWKRGRLLHQEQEAMAVNRCQRGVGYGDLARPGIAPPASSRVSSQIPERLVDADGRAVRECSRVDEPETQRREQVFEQRHPAAQCNWTNY
jgi:hypothetical protein